MNDLFELSYKHLVLATGARERFLPFPGWTLPNVMGAGGLQAMVKCGLPVRGKRVVVAGTGPLLLAVAAYLRRHGAEISMICEQASWSSLARFGVSLFGRPGKVAQALQLKKELSGVPLAANSWPLAAHGRQTLESVTVSQSGEGKTIPCDYLACGFHLVPNIELPLLLGCEVQAGCVRVDDSQQTTVSRVFCAGEPTRIGGVELSLVEGQIAGLAVTGRMTEAKQLFGER
jgi:NADPH-dependent 2,4-dienoyl-CoA reductase/sulfur reductase-like enzyme